MKPICVPCQRFYRPRKNGIFFIEQMPQPGAKNPLPGTLEPQAWTPYKLWVGDLWHCPGCGAEVIVGVGARPVSEHYMPDFAEKVLAYNARLKVNDC